MPKPTTKPPQYRLTVSKAAFWAAMGRGPGNPLFKPPKVAIQRADGKVDIGISYNLLDQLQTAALPKENLSDTIIRLYPAAPAA